MKILITSGLSSTDIGGPFQYAPRLRDEFEKLGHTVKVIYYGEAEKNLPIVIRHMYFALRIFSQVIDSDFVLAFDTYSVGVPTVILSRMLGRKVIVRIGGDYLWESYVERTGHKITLREFNANMPELNVKEKLILFFTKILIKFADNLAFNTEWQRDIWQKRYSVSYLKSYIIRNYIPEKSFSQENNNKFLWAGRRIKLKNIKILEELSKEFDIEMLSGLPHPQLQEKLKNCYAVILPSFSEVCPNFVLEAISYGKPFIVTRETGLKEIYDKGGIFVDPFGKESIRNAILEMMGTEKYEQYRNDLESIQRVRSWQMVAEEYLSL